MKRGIDMDQRGYIVEIIDDKTAKFKMQRQSAWAKCGKCFGSKSSESQDIEVEVDNSFGAKVGDYVEVSMDHINIIKAMAIMYGIPLIALMVGTIGSYYGLKGVLSKDILQGVSIAIGLVFVAISYMLIKLRDAKFKESRLYLPTVTRVIIDLNAVDLNNNQH